jgi:ABC-type antimicrobial peptide transport system permease subunit
VLLSAAGLFVLVAVAAAATPARAATKIEPVLSLRL